MTSWPHAKVACGEPFHSRRNLGKKESANCFVRRFPCQGELGVRRYALWVSIKVYTTLGPWVLELRVSTETEILLLRFQKSKNLELK